MTTVLLGREAERHTLDLLIEDVRRGRGRVLALTGDAGIGKTRLLDHVASQAAGPLGLIRVSGRETEQPQAFSALRRLLEPLTPRVERLPLPQWTALTSAFSRAEAVPVDRFLLALATLTLLAGAAAEQPLICIVDDAQWLDRESLDVLTFVARRLQDDRLGLLFGLRPERPEPGVPAGLPVLALPDLPAPAARELFSATVTGEVDDHTAARVLDETGGNPLALIELAQALTGEQLSDLSVLPMPLPAGPRMQAYFLDQVQALPSRTQQLLLLLSVIGRDQPGILWRVIAEHGLSCEDIDPAVAAGLLVPSRRSVQFRHLLIRSAVYGGASADERRAAHLRLAATVDPERDVAQRAWHLAAATSGPDESVAGELERAAERVSARGEYTGGAALLLRSANLTPETGERNRRTLAAARAHVTIGDRRTAERLLERAEAAGPGVRARAQQFRSTVLPVSGDFAQVPAGLLAAAAEIRSTRPELARDLLMDALVSAMMTHPAGTGTTLPAVARAALERAPGARPDDLPELMIDAIAVRTLHGYAAAVPAMRALIRALVSDGELSETGYPLAILAGLTADELWEHQMRPVLLDRIEAYDRDHGAVNALRITLYAQAHHAQQTGRFETAQQRFAEAAALAAAGDLPADEARTQQAELLAWRGDEAGTRAAAETLRRRWCQDRGVRILAGLAQLSLTVLELGLGRYREALVQARAGYAEDVPGWGTRLLPDLVEAAVKAGDRDTVEAALARLSERAEASATPAALGLLARSRALLADGDQAELLYQEAHRQLSRTPMAPEIARTHLLHGEWLHRSGAKAEARRRLRTAHEMFTGLGAQAFAERARRERSATGERIGKHPGPAAAELTVREHEIARLGAAGATNGEIARQLFVSTSTVEYHLRKVFRKLGLTSRRQLAEVFDTDWQGRASAGAAVDVDHLAVDPAPRPGQQGHQFGDVVGDPDPVHW
jgi:DNA-binding CsgD family transcriptional regulator